MIEPTEVHLLTGAYAVDALEPDDRDAYEAHLVHCEDCRAEVLELQATAAVLGRATAAEPPERLRAAVLAGALTTRQDPPLLRFQTTQSNAKPGGRFIGLVAAAVVLALALVGTTTWAVQQHRVGQQLAANAARMSAVLTAADATTTSDAVTNGGRATVVVSRSQNASVFVGSGLTAPAPDRAYELWFIDASGHPRAAGVFVPNRDGTVATELTGNLAGAVAIAVTVEQRAGTTAPTSKPVVALHLPAV